MIKNALLVGINDYHPSGGIPSLRFAERDATALAGELEKLGFSSRLLVGRQAGRAEIMRAIKEIGSGELLLFFFAGHGEKVDDHFYLHPYDGERESGINSLSFNELARLWKSAKLKHDKCMAILDACRSSLPSSGMRGPSGLNQGVKRDLDHARREHGDLRIFYGCDDNQSCYEYPDLGSGHGLLTYHLLQSIRACSGQSQVALVDICEDAADAMCEWQKQHKGKILQEPTWVGRMTRDRILLRRGEHRAATNPMRQEVVQPTGPMARNIMTEPLTGMELVFVPGGRYQMGDTFGDGFGDEQPVHNIRVDSFWLGKYPVTQGQWQEVMGDNPASFKIDAVYPVENVNWDDVQEYIRELNAKTGKKYRLPSEAEWEYAARSCGKSEKYAGTSEASRLGEYVWYNQNSGTSTQPVGQKKPNGLGLYDMSGNVWEWCQDRWHDDYDDAPTNGSVWEIGESQRRVNRGGGWDYGVRSVRVACRRGYLPESRGAGLGFRLCLPVE